MTPNPTPMHTENPGFSTLFVKSGVQNRWELQVREFDPEVDQTLPRYGFTYSSPNEGLIEWMPAMRAQEQVALKIVGYHPSNPALHNLPTILSTASAYDTATRSFAYFQLRAALLHNSGRVTDRSQSCLNAIEFALTQACPGLTYDSVPHI